jgi:hypothetical protein
MASIIRVANLTTTAVASESVESKVDCKNDDNVGTTNT